MTDWVDAEGVRLAVEVIGDGEPVSVVAHGLTGSRRQLSMFAPYVPGTKVLFDFRGHGESERPPAGSYSMDHFAGDVLAVADAYGATAVLGASLGGGATLRLLTRLPERFERVVFLLPARLEGDVASLEARRRLLRVADLLEAHPLERAAELIVAAEAAEGAFDGFTSSRDARRQSILEMNRDGIPAAIRGCVDDPPVRDLAQVAGVMAPALVIGQGGDIVHRIEVARDLAEALPRGELVPFEDQTALVEGIPEIVRRISAFVAGSPAAQR